MARTKGSGWGAGPILWQICPLCGKKKAYYDYNSAFGGYFFRCTWCKERIPFDQADNLIKQTNKN